MLKNYIEKKLIKKIILKKIKHKLNIIFNKK